MSKLLQLLCPDECVGSVPLIDLTNLKNRQIEALLLDLDNTIVPWRSYDVAPEVAEWVSKARQGMKVCLVSNSRTPRRVSKLAEELRVSFVKQGGKPRRVGFKAALKLLGVEPSRAAVIGDQVFTDILGGNRLGAHTILVRPLHRREFIGTKVSRLAEKLVLRMLERRGMIANQSSFRTSEREQLPNSDCQKKAEQ